MKDELSVLERDILEIAENLALTNRLITIETLYKEAKQKIQAPRIELSNAVYNLVLKKYIIFSTKMTKTLVLLNENRHRIHQFIIKNPGCHLREIMRALDIKGQMMNWHLFTLERFEFIYRIKYLKYVNFFPKGFDRNLIFPFLALKDSTSLKVFSQLWDRPVLTLSDLKPLIQMDLTTLKYHLGKLLKSKVVQTQEINNQDYFILNKEVLIPLQKYLNTSLENLKKFFQLQDQIIIARRNKGVSVQ